MANLHQLLERLRRVRLPPGAAASAVAVPSPGDSLSAELEFLFADLEAIEQRSRTAVSAARSQAAEIEAAATRDRRRLLEEANAEAERLAASVIAERRARCEERSRGMLLDAEREADRIVARGRERIPRLVEQITRQMLEGPR